MEVRGHKIEPCEDGFIDSSGNFFGAYEEEVAEQIEAAYNGGYIGDIMDSHSCYENAEYTSNGPAGAGKYCTVCGALVGTPQEY